MIRCLIFDLCDTVVRTAGIGGLLHLPGMEGRHDARSVEQWFRESPVFPAYERGQVSTADFLRTFRTDLGLEASEAELARAYERLVVAEIEGVAAWLADLEGRWPLYALSNNNPLLWKGVQRVSTCLNAFRHIFLSQEIGLLKPAPEAFEHVLERLECAPAEAALIDDNPSCVRAARRLGLRAVHFSGVPAARLELQVLLEENATG